MDNEVLNEAKELVKLVLVPQLTPKDFASGSVGFYANGKLTINGKKYQSQLMLVEVGSKEKKGKKK